MLSFYELPTYEEKAEEAHAARWRCDRCDSSECSTWPHCTPSPCPPIPEQDDEPF